MSTTWLHDAIVYQIFPERFAVGRGLTAVDKQKQGLYSGRNHSVSDWNELPRVGWGQNEQFFGGDLEGIREKIPYLQELGVNLVYLTPFYASPTNHRYDTTDYFSIDPGSGDFEDFSRLVEDIHRHEMRIIIDLPLNHISDKHPIFQEACRNPDSPYRDFFRFIDYPNQYIGWYGYREMPELNFANPAVIEYFLTGEHSVLHFWLEHGVDGFRLDTANDLGVPLMRLIRDTVHRVRSDAVVIGEVSQYPGEWVRAMDGVQSYYFRTTLLSFIFGEINLRAFNAALADIINRLSLSEQLGLFNQVGSHDAPRLVTLLQEHPEHYQFFLGMIFSFPGVPMIYYGEENGMEGGNDPLNRAPMIWDQERWNPSVRELFIRWIQLRHERRELRCGRTLLLTDRCRTLIGFVRCTEHPDEYSVVFLNPTRHVVREKFMLPFPYLHSQLTLEDVFSDARIISDAGAITVEAQPHQVLLLVPNMNSKPNYSFSKSWHAVRSEEPDDKLMRVPHKTSF